MFLLPVVRHYILQYQLKITVLFNIEDMGFTMWGEYIFIFDGSKVIGDIFVHCDTFVEVTTAIQFTLGACSM